MGFRISVAAPTIALLWLCGCTPVATHRDSVVPLTRTDVLQFMDRWVTAEASEDFNQLVPLIHPQAVYRSSGGDHFGIDAIRGSFEGTFASNPDQRYVVEDTKITYVGAQSATVVYAWIWTGTTPDGVSFKITGRGSKVVVRDETGLRLRLLHLNQDSAVATDE